MLKNTDTKLSRQEIHRRLLVYAPSQNSKVKDYLSDVYQSLVGDYVKECKFPG